MELHRRLERTSGLGIPRLPGYTTLVQYLREMSLSEKDPARGARLKALRKARNLIQADVAAELESDVGSVSRWERGFSISPEYLAKLATFYEVSESFIVDGHASQSTVTYPAFEEYKEWLKSHPEERDMLPAGAIENIRAFRLTISPEYEPTLQSYMVLHGFMTGLRKRKRGRS